VAGWSWWHPLERSSAPRRRAETKWRTRAVRAGCRRGDACHIVHKAKRGIGLSTAARGAAAWRRARHRAGHERRGDVARVPAGPITRSREMTRRRSSARRSSRLRRRRRGEGRSARAKLASEGESVPRRPREGSLRERAETPSFSAARSSGSQRREIEPDRPRSQDRGRTAQTFLPPSEVDLGMATLHCQDSWQRRSRRLSTS
jgi:hypothetical protein